MRDRLQELSLGVPGPGQLRRHVVEGLAQVGQLVVAVDCDRHSRLAPRDASGGFGECGDRPDQAARQEIGEQCGEHGSAEPGEAQAAQEGAPFRKRDRRRADEHDAPRGARANHVEERATPHIDRALPIGGAHRDRPQDGLGAQRPEAASAPAADAVDLVAGRRLGCSQLVGLRPQRGGPLLGDPVANQHRRDGHRERA